MKTKLIIESQEYGFTINALSLNNRIDALEKEGYEFVSQETRVTGPGDGQRIVAVTTVVMQKEGE